jgi:hypothetical protein
MLTADSIRDETFAVPRVLDQVESCHGASSTHACDSGDRLDALAMAVAYWAKALSVETDKVVQSDRDKLMKQELERYIAHAIGAKPRGFIYAPTSHR